MLYPHALDKELAEMLSVVTRQKQVKGQDNLEQQMAELKEVFAVYDEDGTGQLEQAEFVEAIVSAGLATSITQHQCLTFVLDMRTTHCLCSSQLCPYSKQVVTAVICMG